MESRIGPSASGQIPEAASGDAGKQSTTVMMGETQISQVAERLGISSEALQAANPNLAESVTPGQELHLPQEPISVGTLMQTDVSEGTAAPRSNIKSMVGDLNLGGQMRRLEIEGFGTEGEPSGIPATLFSDPVVHADTKANPGLRLSVLPGQLTSAKIPQKLQNELLTQASKKSGPELASLLDQIDTAIASKNPVDGLKSIVMQGRVDAYYESFNATYTVNGKSVQATPHFRISAGFSGQPGRTSGDKVQDDLNAMISKRDRKDYNAAMKQAIHGVAYGRATAGQIKMVTEALIKSGQFEVSKKMHPGLSDSETIRMMQWDNGVGIDCAGYVQQAFMGVHGGGRDSFGFKPFGEENLISLKGNPHFSQVKAEDVKPGDLIILDAPQKGDVGHTVLVRSAHVAGANERKNFHDPDGFAKSTDTVRVYEVDASFGAGEDGDLQGGLQRKTWLFNETTQKWGQAYPDGKGGFEIKASSRTGPYDHPMNGIYHPKGE